MLRAIINGQSAMKSEILGKIGKLDGKIEQLDKKLTNRIDKLEKKANIGFKGINGRIDKLGKSLAYLEDDTPTRDEFDNLEKRVTNAEHSTASA